MSTASSATPKADGTKAASTTPSANPNPTGGAAAATADVEVFTTARVLLDHAAESSSKAGPSHRVPLLEAHAARLTDGLRVLAPERADAVDASSWQRRISEAVASAISGSDGQDVVRSGDLRMKVSVGVSNRALRVEFFPFASSPFYSSIRDLSPPPPEAKQPRIALSPRPLSQEEIRSPSLLVKTSERAIYNSHTALLHDARQQPQSVLLYVSRPTTGLTDAADWDPEESLFLTETTIANVLFLPCGSAGEPPAADARWLTPRLGTDTPFLPGLQRAALLARGEAEERDITLAQAKRWVAAGGRVACANALRSVWDVQVDWQ